MSLAKKLNLKDGMTVHAVGKPASVDLTWSALRFRPAK
jgi:hypothetical protein